MEIEIEPSIPEPELPSPKYYKKPLIFSKWQIFLLLFLLTIIILLVFLILIGTKKEAINENTEGNLFQPKPFFNIINNCKEKWNCTAWSECENGLMTRDCIETNNCLKITSSPKTSKEC